jgi:hypothetical protein
VSGNFKYSKESVEGKSQKTYFILFVRIECIPEASHFKMSFNSFHILGA